MTYIGYQTIPNGYETKPNTIKAAVIRTRRFQIVS